jgi:hypothetical protein
LQGDGLGDTQDKDDVVKVANHFDHALIDYVKAT